MRFSKVYEEIKKAICESDVEKVEKLTKKGKYLLLKGVNGNTLLHIAALCGNKKVCKVLLENLDEKIEKKSNEILVKSGYNPEDLDYEEVFECDFILDQEKLMKWFSSRFKNKQGKSPVHLAVEAGNVAFIEAFSGVAYVNFILDIRDNFGNLPVHYAAASGKLEILKCFLNDVNEKNADGDTPLHIAAKNGHKEVIKLLVMFGADIKAENNYGLTPLKLAKLYEQEEVTAFISDIEKGKLAEDIVPPLSLRERIPRVFIGSYQVNDYLEIMDDFTFSFKGGNNG